MSFHEPKQQMHPANALFIQATRRGHKRHQLNVGNACLWLVVFGLLYFTLRAIFWD